MSAFGFERHNSNSCDGETLTSSYTHATPYDCAQLCLSIAGCGAFSFSNQLNECMAKGYCLDYELSSNIQYDTYRITGIVCHILAMIHQLKL